MTYEELQAFKRNTAEPMRKELFDKTKLKEGMGFIDSLEINYLDSRNCPYDKRIVARGLEFKDGKVVPCEIEEFDVSLNEFLKNIKYPYIFHGVLVISDEIRPIEINTEIGLSKRCAALVEELSCMDNITCLGYSIEYQKMLYIHGETPVEEPTVDLKMGGGL